MAREYKDSGIEWIGEIPKEWKVARIKTIFKERTELSETGTEKLLSVSEYYGVDSRASRIDEGEYLSRSESLVGYKKCYERDFVSNIMLAWKGSFGVTKIDGIVSPAYCVYQPSDSIYSYYYHYLFRTSLYTTRFKLFSRGIIDSRLRLYSPYFYDIEAIIPPLSEQQKIANYLDKVCGEVDEMIALQEQMIEELKAYKQSVITEAVTIGLNPDAPMKDSGIDWIGKVPEHREIVRLKALGGLQNGISQSGDYFGEDFEFPFISYSDVYKNIEIPYPSGRANSTIEDRTRYSVLEGDVLFTRTSETIEEIGFAATCTNTIYNAVFSGFLIRFRPNSNKLFKGYSKYYFRSDIHRAYFVKEMNLVTRASLSQDLLKNLFVLIPSFSEQQSIASYLDTKCAEIDTLIAIKQAKIEELKDYKKSVIYEYVTGKKEVV